MKRQISTTNQEDDASFSFSFSPNDESDSDIAQTLTTPTQLHPHTHSEKKAKHLTYTQELDHKLSSQYHLLEKMTNLPYKFAICRDNIFTLQGPVLNSGDIVIVNWLSSGFYDLTVYPLYFKWNIDLACLDSMELTLTSTPSSLPGFSTQDNLITSLIPPKKVNIFNLNDTLLESTYISPNIGISTGSITVYPSTKTLAPFLSQTSPCISSLVNSIDYSPIQPLVLAPIAIQLQNVTFITPISTIELIKQSPIIQSTAPAANCHYTNRHSPYVFEIYPFLSQMSHPFTHLPPHYTRSPLNSLPFSSPMSNILTTAIDPRDTLIQTPDHLSTPSIYHFNYPQHYSAAPLTVDSTLPTWTWPVQEYYFKEQIYNKKAFIVHAGGQRLSEIKADLSNFQVKDLIDTSSSTIVWMKTQPNEQPIYELGQQYGERTMQYVGTSPETAYASYLAGNTIYFNPADHIQAKYVKNLAISLGHSYGYTPGSNMLQASEHEEGYTFLDQTSNFGGDLEIFAVNTKHTTDWHLDAQDNISIQLVGTKQWSIVQGLDHPITNYHPKSTNKYSVIADKHLHRIAADGNNIFQNFQNNNNTNAKSPQHCFSSNTTNPTQIDTHSPTSHIDSHPHTSINSSLTLNDSLAYSNINRNSTNCVNFDSHPNKEVFIVRPGTIFYHPAGTYHRVDALDDDGSLSINISLDTLRYSDIVLSQLSQLIMAHPVLRQRVNIEKDNVKDVLHNVFSSVLPQILDALQGTTSTLHNSIPKPNMNNNEILPITNQGTDDRAFSLTQRLFIPALYADSQIHDYPLSTILSQSPQMNSLYYPLFSLLYKDHGCINLLKHLHLPSINVSPSTPSQSSFQQYIIDFSTNIKPNRYVFQYFPSLELFFSTNHAETSSSALSTLLSKIPHEKAFLYNPTIQCITNEPAFTFSASPTIAQNLSIPQLTTTMITSLKSYIVLHTSMNSRIFNQNAPQLDLTTLPNIFFGTSFAALYHLFSICHGISSLNTTSTITSTAATSAKLAPQYSIGIVLDASKFIPPHSTASKLTSPQTSNTQHISYYTATLLSRIFLQQILFIQFLIIQRAPLFASFSTILSWCDMLTDVTIDIITCIHSTTNNSLPKTNTDPILSIDRTQLTLATALILINLLSLYMHCGLLVPPQK